MRAGILAGALLTLAAQASHARAAEGDVCGRAVTSIAQIAAELAADPRLKPSPNGGPDFLAYSEEQPLRLWFVTKTGYPEIQAVICRVLQEKDGRFFVAVESRCNGPKPLCDRLVAFFSRPTN